MARVAGIQIEKDSKGHMTYARINLKKHKDLFPYLEQKGVIEEEIVINPDDYITGDELLKRLPPRFKKLFSK